MRCRAGSAGVVRWIAEEVCVSGGTVQLQMQPGESESILLVMLCQAVSHMRYKSRSGVRLREAAVVLALSLPLARATYTWCLPLVDRQNVCEIFLTRYCMDHVKYRSYPLQSARLFGLQLLLEAFELTIISLKDSLHVPYRLSQI